MHLSINTLISVCLQVNSNYRLTQVLLELGQCWSKMDMLLLTAEQNYSTVQRECLAIVVALKQFRHYLLGCKFTQHTDHAPLEWLSVQIMEGFLGRWAQNGHPRVRLFYCVSLGYRECERGCPFSQARAT